MEVLSLGVDLASRSWRDMGFGLLAWSSNRWTRAEPGCLRGAGTLSPETVASCIDQFARERGVAIVSIDGPQGWREPDAAPRQGVGRLCEYQARTQGKTGEYGKAYPGTQRGWIEFSISVFDALLALPGVALANTPAPLRSRESGYWVLECFPTESWRNLGLQPLPAKSAAPPSMVSDWAQQLWSKLSLPRVAAPFTHDDLQAIVAATAGVAALGGPLALRIYGKPAWGASASSRAPAHRVEGLIWSATDRPSAA